MSLALRPPLLCKSFRALLGHQSLCLYDVSLHRCQFISTSHVCCDERSLKASPEMSWVRKILQGSGPSADIDETSLDDEVVEVEPRYMEILQQVQSSFISRPETRRKQYSPPHDVEERLKEMTLQFTNADPENWRGVSLKDNTLKYQLLSKCGEDFHHSIPNYKLRKMKTVEDIVSFYQRAVKDTSFSDELVTKELPPNLHIQWDYNDSKLEVYEDYLAYVKKKGSKRPPEWPFRPSQ